MESRVDRFRTHPCFGPKARQLAGRMHLPVAPRANTRVRFSDTSKTGPAMPPEEAVAWLDRVMAAGTRVNVVGITGPGDPLAAPEPTLETLRMVHERHPEISLCLTTSGIGGEALAPALAELHLSHVTVEVNAVSAEIVERLYAWVRPSTHTVPLARAAEILVDEQARAVAAFKKAGLTVKVNTMVYAGYNAAHVEEIAKTMAGLGADIMALVPFVPAEGDTEAPPEPGADIMETVYDAASRHIDMMPAWNECGRDIVGLDKGTSRAASALPKPSKERPNVAVASTTGMDVDLHLGQASRLLIYGPREDGLACLLGTRLTPAPGGGASRWDALADTLHDCFAVLTASAGDNPRKILGGRGITVMITDNEIEGTVDVLYGGGKKGRKGKGRA